MSPRSSDLNWKIPRPGDTIDDKFVVEGVCGHGGLSAVLSAKHVGLDQRVAIKVLLPEWAGDHEVVERFVREGRAATSIRSEHVVRALDVGTLPSGAPYLVLEYLEGLNLDDVIVTWGPLPVPTAIDWILQAAEAIAEAHANGIVHRDLKPANLFLTRRADGSACIKVIDFGLSKVTDAKMKGAGTKLTQPNEVFGTPHYMAPEQLRASTGADIPADLWALGAVLHEMLSGRPPFHGETMPEVCAMVLTEPAPPLTSVRPGVPAEVEAAVLRCLQKEAGDRFVNIAELARALAPFGSNEARGSCARIERVMEEGGRAPRPSDPSCPPMLLDPPWPEPAEPSGSYLVRPAKPLLPRLILGASLGAGGLLAALIVLVYSLAHGSAAQAPNTNSTGPHANRPSASETASEVALPPAPAEQPAPSPAPALSAAGPSASVERLTPLGPPALSPTPASATPPPATPTGSGRSASATPSWRARSLMQTHPTAVAPASSPKATAPSPASITTAWIGPAVMPQTPPPSSRESTGEAAGEDVFEGRR